VANILNYVVGNGGSLHGTIRVPGDKSISHRAVMLASIAQGVSTIRDLLLGTDVLATVAAMRSLGVRIDDPGKGTIAVHGVGLDGLHEATVPLDLGNSGTAIRLLTGLLAGSGVGAVLVGDESLSQRPMLRVAEPLRTMGAILETSATGTPPIRILPQSKLHGIHYTLPVASAQVKSAILLAALNAQGETCVTELAPTRDHTERMLKGFGADCSQHGNAFCLRGGQRLHATDVDVPSDLSSAAFFIVGASIASGSGIELPAVGVNPTRTGLLDVLTQMGADIRLLNLREVCGEPVADVVVRAAPLRGITVQPALVPRSIDEFPALCIAAACAQGTTNISGAGELRHKESDRISAMADGLRQVGIDVQEQKDGMSIKGGSIAGGVVDSRGDHRVAMSFCVAALCAQGPITVRNCANIATSFPGFVELARRAGVRLDE